MVVVVVAVSGGGVGTYRVADGCRHHVIVVVEVAGDVVVRDLLSGFWTSSSCPGDHTMVVVDVVVVTDERTCRERCCCVHEHHHRCVWVMTNVVIMALWW